ncbi:MAG: prepilin peptidase [candidate division KSB1 bacterium]|nr:prepilin peptidase [candidate division KSB1 bacterium]
MEPAILFVLGAILGSFLNVVIYRLPRKQSIVSPGSTCPFCSHRLRPWENVPIVSYLVLRGRCSKCRHRIPIRYFIVEVLTPVLLLTVFAFYGLSWPFFKNSLLILLLIPIVFIDLDHRLILNKITLPGMALGLALSIAEHPQQFYQPVLGMLAGGGLLWLIAILGQIMYKQESMGGGDIKLGAMIGAFMNPQSILLALFLAFFIAALFSVVGMVIGKLQRHNTIPFGPFIAAGAYAVVSFKQQIVMLYLNYIMR